MVQALRTSLRYGGLRQGGLQPGLGNDDIFATASLDLNFAVNKNLGTLVDATTGTTLVNHTRATKGTYVGSDGLIKTATTNLLSWSEDFTNAVWQTSNPGEVTLITGVADPLGGVNATTLFHDSGAGDTGWLRRVNTGIIGLSYRFSFWIRRRSGSGDFNVVLGDNISQTVSGITSEWQRVSVSNVPTSTTLRTYLKVDRAGDEFDIFGAQLEQSSTVGEYVKTTSTINSAPRFDHDPTTGESLGLLVEESRTNLISDSSGAQSTAFGGSNTSSTEINPEGAASCRKLQAFPGNDVNGHRIRIAASSNNATTVSAFVKKSTHRYVYIGFGGILNSYTALFDIEPGVPGNRLLGQSGHGTYTNISAGYKEYANGWVRIWATGTTSGTDGLTVGLSPNNTTYFITDWSATGLESIFLHGLQYEDDVTFPTSYIPTEGTTVTRAADVADISGNNFGTTNLLTYSEEFDQSYWAKVRCSVTPNAELAPNNTLTADAIVEDTSTNTHILQADGVTTSVSGATYTYSWHLKAGERTDLRIAFGTDGGVWQSETVDIDLSDGTLSNVSGFTTTPIVQNVGNGWYRLSATVTAQASANGVIRMTPIVGGTPIYTGDGSSKYYIWGAQVEQSDVVTPYVKSNVTWDSRASNATYYDSTGTIRKSSYNELLWSEEFDQSPWTLNFATPTPNAAIAPNGAQTADLLTSTTSATYSRAWQSVATAGSAMTGSCYLRTDTPFTGSLRMRKDGSEVAVKNISVDTDWKRFDITDTSNFSSSCELHIFLNPDGLAGASVSGRVLYVWGAQLEKGTYAGDYAKTEATAASTARNAAYLPDDNGNFVSAGPLLLEEQRTNLSPYSSYVAGQWTFGAASLGTSTRTSPDGSTVTAFLTDTSSAPHRINRSLSGSYTANTLYTFSFYVAKPASSDILGIIARIRTSAGGQAVSFFVSNNGEQSEYTFNNSVPFGANPPAAITSDSVSINSVGSNWTRIAITTAVADVNTTLTQWDIGFSTTSGSDIGAGTANSEIYIWGAQLEEGSYPSSYIPTYGIAATRSADVSTSTSGFGNSWYRQDEGTVFAEANGSGPLITPRATASTGDRIQLSYGISAVVASGSVQASFGDTTAAKRVLAYKANNTNAAFDGVIRVNDTNCAIPSVDYATIGYIDFGGATRNNGAIKRITFWPQRLPDPTLSTITQ